jgi:hypothetical protein
MARSDQRSASSLPGRWSLTRSKLLSHLRRDCDERDVPHGSGKPPVVDPLGIEEGRGGSRTRPSGGKQSFEVTAASTNGGPPPAVARSPSRRASDEIVSLVLARADQSGGALASRSLCARGWWGVLYLGAAG